jgi:uncharacterized membrane protein YgcG
MVALNIHLMGGPFVVAAVAVALVGVVLALTQIGVSRPASIGGFFRGAQDASDDTSDAGDVAGDAPGGGGDTSGGGSDGGGDGCALHVLTLAVLLSVAVIGATRVVERCCV